MVAGVNKQLRIYDEDQELETYHVFKETHPDEISCLDFHHKDLALASSSYNGDVFIWSIDRAIVLLSFNMYESVMAINRQPTKRAPKFVGNRQPSTTSSFHSSLLSKHEHHIEYESKKAAQIVVVSYSLRCRRIGIWMVNR